MSDERVGELIRSARYRAGMSQRGLARRIERRHSVVSRWEAGRLEPTVLDLVRVARVLQEDVERLVLASGPGRRWSSRSHARSRRRQIGAALHYARAARGLSLREAVLVTGIDGLRISRIERGTDPSLEELRALLGFVALNVPEFLHSLRRRDRAQLLDTPVHPTRPPVQPWSVRRIDGTGNPRIGLTGPATGWIPNYVSVVIQDITKVLGPLAA